MSWGSRIFLLGSCFATGIIVLGVHYMQHQEREQLYEGVLRDIERRALNANKKAGNLYLLEQQKELEKYLRKEQERTQNQE